MESYNNKEVYFHEYCPKCKHRKKDESDDICNECLAQGYNINSHKPIKFEEQKK